MELSQQLQLIDINLRFLHAKKEISEIMGQLYSLEMKHVEGTGPITLELAHVKERLKTARNHFDDFLVRHCTFSNQAPIS